MSVNSFLKDLSRGSPLIKALAMRTLGYLGVHELNLYILDPIVKGLSDDDPYVRKSAVFSLGKVYDISPTLCEE